jgi:hypothetical protein
MSAKPTRNSVLGVFIVHTMYCVCDEMQSTWGLSQEQYRTSMHIHWECFTGTQRLFGCSGSRHYQSCLRLYTFRVVAASKNQKPIHFTISLSYRFTTSSLCSTFQLTINLSSCYSTILSLPTLNVICVIHT